MDDLYTRAYGAARYSEPRLAIARIAEKHKGAFTVDELVLAVRSSGATRGATATVYRAVAAMEESGYLVRVGERDGATLYTHCDVRSHHHHIVCDGCGRIAAAECPLGPDPELAPRADGFVITRHEVTLYGLCPECATSSERRGHVTHPHS